jgi:hypothetical protein
MTGFRSPNGLGNIPVSLADCFGLPAGRLPVPSGACLVASLFSQASLTGFFLDLVHLSQKGTQTDNNHKDEGYKIVKQLFHWHNTPF